VASIAWLCFDFADRLDENWGGLQLLPPNHAGLVLVRFTPIATAKCRHATLTVRPQHSIRAHVANGRRSPPLVPVLLSARGEAQRAIGRFRSRDGVAVNCLRHEA
jgi:hypothetical protein